MRKCLDSATTKTAAATTLTTTKKELHQGLVSFAAGGIIYLSFTHVIDSPLQEVSSAPENFFFDSFPVMLLGVNNNRIQGTQVR